MRVTCLEFVLQDSSLHLFNFKKRNTIFSKNGILSKSVDKRATNLTGFGNLSGFFHRI